MTETKCKQYTIIRPSNNQMTLNERAVATSDDQATIKVPVMRMLAFAPQATSKQDNPTYVETTQLRPKIKTHL